MKKLFFVACLALLEAPLLHALPLGNPDSAGLLQNGLIWNSELSYPTTCDSNSDCCLNFCDKFNCQLGFYGDYVLNRFLETNVPTTSLFPDTIGTAAPTNPVANPAYNQKMSSAQMFTNAGSITFNFWKRVDLFGTLGAMNAYVKGASSAFNMSGIIGTAYVAGTTPLQDAINDSVIEMYTRGSFCWSLGARGTVLQCKSLSLGLEGQYLKSNSTIDELNVLSNSAQFYITNPKGFPKTAIATNVLPNTVPTERAFFDYQEWQFGGGLALNIKAFVPYVGFKWSKVDCKMGGVVVPQSTSNLANPYIPATPGANPDVTANQDFRGVCVKLNDLQVQNHFGLILGSTLVDSQKMLLSLEARVIDEIAFHVNGQIRF